MREVRFKINTLLVYLTIVYDLKLLTWVNNEKECSEFNSKKVAKKTRGINQCLSSVDSRTFGGKVTENVFRSKKGFP